MLMKILFVELLVLVMTMTKVAVTMNLVME